MLIAVVSDTHGHVEYTLDAIREIERRQPDLVLHCGDIGSAAVVSLFARRETRFVFGNVDDPPILSHAIHDAGSICDEEFGEMTFGGRRIAFLHGHDELRLRETIRSGEFDLVCHGHTHRRRWEQVGRTWVLNPGAIFRATPHSVAFVTLPDLTVEFVALPSAAT
ncbi:MAG: YfcE family phosphodiesterase [Planctomycetota bacterium]|nr:metallophosphoesterase family protein [Planctomycetaceae bacterium]MDQ3330581.1 YfcE family phosphodiesterase [Planctomycetota bacterium]